MAERMSTAKIVFGKKITVGAADGSYVAQHPAGANCIELVGYRGEVSNTVRVGLRADHYPCFLCKIFIEGPEKDRFEWSYDGAAWYSSQKHLFFPIVFLTNHIFYLRAQSFSDEEIRDYVDNYLLVEFQAPIGSSI